VRGFIGGENHVHLYITGKQVVRPFEGLLGPGPINSLLDLVGTGIRGGCEKSHYHHKDGKFFQLLLSFLISELFLLIDREHAGLSVVLDSFHAF